MACRVDSLLVNFCLSTYGFDVNYDIGYVNYVINMDFEHCEVKQRINQKKLFKQVRLEINFYLDINHESLNKHTDHHHYFKYYIIQRYYSDYIEQDINFKYYNIYRYYFNYLKGEFNQGRTDIYKSINYSHYVEKELNPRGTDDKVLN